MRPCAHIAVAALAESGTHAEAGTLVRRMPLQPYANASTGYLEYVLPLNVTRAARYRVSFLLADAAAATQGAEAPLLLTVIPGPPIAATSSFIGAQQLCAPLCAEPTQQALLRARGAHDLHHGSGSQRV